MADGDEPAVRITLRHIYDEVTHLRSEVTSLVKAVPDHESRIRDVEKWMYALPVTFVLALVGAVTTLLKSQ